MRLSRRLLRPLSVAIAAVGLVGLPLGGNVGAAADSPLGGGLLQPAPAASAASNRAGGNSEDNQSNGNGGATKAAAAGTPAPGGSPLGGSLLGAPAGAGNGSLGGGLLQGGPAAEPSTVFVPGRPPPAPPPQSEKNTEEAAANKLKGAEDHAALFKVSEFPSALQCAVCHPVQFRQWSISQHAYAEISVVFHAMQHSINYQLSGSNGDFCARCHSDIAGFLSEPADSAVLERHAISREGITCITCHRIAKAYNKVSGRLAMIPGGITDPVYGPLDDKELKRVIADPKYHVEANPKRVGLLIHADAVEFAPIKSSTFCGSCHDVTLFNGFRLEEAFSEYRTSPAAAEGITCQDCHMGKIQGKVSGFERGPAAVVNGIPTEIRTLHDHTFSGPDYPIVHPGLFPFNKEAQDLANVNQWTQFDYKAGWGTDAFEKHIPPGYKFPPHWRSVDDRYEAAKIIREQLKLLAYHKQKRLEVLRNGYGLGAVTTTAASRDGIAFSVQVRNLTNGHNVPTGFTEERPLWLAITVTDPNGNVIFRSGDRDPNGDLRDRHSEWVRAGLVPLDSQLFNLQGRVMTRNLRGSEEPAVLPIPYSQTALPYVRPSTFSQILLGRPTVARNQKESIDPLGSRTADYSVGAAAMRGPGIYHVAVQLMSQAVPVNLLLASQYVGFDYNYSPRTVVDNVLAGAVVIAQRDFPISVQ
ncbi:MAG TPA: multiheme c-type cytochrome [Stellaceae bacterium]|nr:multiheme c-type cytochrome [Stellaceae bacterium]